ncbi:hypothetical protein DAI22_08g107700 [Oryza sativa Japonica Group]|nr:hypothetical protein DAI22_08g107700 [Oryza sativa Japonica Group]
MFMTIIHILSLYSFTPLHLVSHRTPEKSPRLLACTVATTALHHCPYCRSSSRVPLPPPHSTAAPAVTPSRG